MENAYDVLGLAQGFQSTEGEIKKVSLDLPPPPPPPPPGPVTSTARPLPAL